MLAANGFQAADDIFLLIPCRNNNSEPRIWLFSGRTIF